MGYEYRERIELDLTELSRKLRIPGKLGGECGVLTGFVVWLDDGNFREQPWILVFR